MGIDNSSIRSCCNGKLQTCGGFKWRFYDGPLLDCKYCSSNSRYQYEAIYYKYDNITDIYLSAAVCGSCHSNVSIINIFNVYELI